MMPFDTISVILMILLVSEVICGRFIHLDRQKTEQQFAWRGHIIRINNFIYLTLFITSLRYLFQTVGKSTLQISKQYTIQVQM